MWKRDHPFSCDRQPGPDSRRLCDTPNPRGGVYQNPRHVSKCPSINGYFVRSRRYAQILVLEIPQCIPVAKIFACLDLEQTISFMDEHRLTYMAHFEIEFASRGALNLQSLEPRRHCRFLFSHYFPILLRVCGQY